MLRILKKTIKSGIVTIKYPYRQDIAPVGFRGKPGVDSNRCTFCGDCAKACPTDIICLNKDRNEMSLTLDYGGCIFCGLCEEVCQSGAIRLTQEYELASRTKEDLVTVVRRKL